MLELILLVVGVVAFQKLSSRFTKQDTRINALVARVTELEQSVRQTQRSATTVAETTVRADVPVSGAAPAPVPPPGTLTGRTTAATTGTTRTAEATSGVAPRAATVAPVTIPTPLFKMAASDPPMLETGRPRRSIEAEIGSRWLLYVGIVAIVVGAAYFQKLALENGWINESARVVQGAIVGLLLAYGGRRFIRAGYSLYGQMLAGGGIAVLYVSTYAASTTYQLVSRPAAMVLMCAVTAFAAWMADRYRSQGLALMAVGGGFATPFLLPSASDAQLALFAYDAVLVAGTMYLAHRRVWPALNVVSYAFIVLTVAAWAARFYTPAKYLTTELFLTLYCGMFVYIVQTMRRSSGSRAVTARLVLWTAPAFYYLASLVVLAPHPTPMLVYLMALAIAGAAIGARLGAVVRLGFWLAVAAPLLLWVNAHPGPEWLTAGLVALSVVYTVNLASHFEASSGRDAIDMPDVIRLHLNGLVLAAAALWLIEAVRPAWTAPVAGALALGHGALAAALVRARREHALQFVALASVLLTVAIALQFDGYAVTFGWATEGVALVWLGLRERRDWMRAGGAVLFGAAALQLLNLQLVTSRLPSEWIVLNGRALCGLYLVGLSYLVAWLHRERPAGERSVEASAALATAQLLTLSVVSAEINAFYAESASATLWRLNREALQALAWAVTGARVIDLGIGRRTAWLRAMGAAVLVAGVLRAVEAAFRSAPEGYIVLANTRFLVMAGIVGSLYGVAARYVRHGSGLDAALKPRTVLLYAANLLTLLALTSEVMAFWDLRGVALSGWRSGDRVSQLARGMMISIVWALYSTGLIVVGIRRRQAALRYLAMGVFAVTIGKVFLVDLAELDQIYRVLSIVGVGVTLLVTSFLYHRFRGSIEWGQTP